MIGTLSKAKVFEQFRKTDARITVISFDKNGKRLLTYSCVNIFQAMREIARRAKDGSLIKLYLDLPKHIGIDNSLEEYQSKKYKPWEM